ncbi:MAG: TlpA family protein disulfide reductase [Proteobacteria bacterium]|nr:TlpA family protein disulfide reductase [Pseudomonadota bacterium]
MRKSIKWVAVLMVSLLLLACGIEPATPKIGQPSPAFNLERLDGSHIQFPGDLKGKVVVVQFWADWCPPCIHEMIALAPVYAKYQPQGLVFLAVNMRQDKAIVKKWAAQINAPYEYLLDSKGETSLAYGVEALPTGFIVDREGLISARILGEPTTETFEQIIQELL